MNQILAIDPEFEAKCPPLTEEEFQQLEENILEEGLILMPLIIWNNIIVDGHNRYKIAQQHPGIEFRTHEKLFDSRYEAISWICKNQLGRRNLTPMQKKYLIGQRYEAEKYVEEFHGNQYTSSRESGGSQIGNHQNGQKTCERIAEEIGISKNSVLRAEAFAKGVDAAEEVLPGIKDDLLTGKYRPRESDVAAIARASPEERLKKVEKLKVTSEDKKAARDEADKQTQTGIKRKRKDYEDIDKIYEELKAPKRVTEASALESLRSVARNMIETSDVLFEHFPGLLSIQTYKEKVIEIMQEPKQYIIKLEGETENE